MTERDVNLFEWRIKHILEWSNLDAGTRTALEAILAEVVAFVRQNLQV